MQTLLVVLTVLVSIVLIFVVLIQKSKGGGLASNFASSNQIMGVRRTNDFIEKTTWTLAIIIFFLAVFASILSPSQTATNQRQYDIDQQQQQSMPTPFTTPVTPGADETAPATPAQQTATDITSEGASQI